jgi:hypothetical protein
MPREVYGIAGEVTGFVRFTGQARFAPSDEGTIHYLDLGSVDGHKFEVTPALKPVMASRRFGVRKTVREDVISLDTIYTLHLQEEVKETMLMRMFGTAGSDVVQASGSAGTATITAVQKRRWYKLGKRLVTAVIVKVSTVTMVVGTDYLLDAEMGMIYVLEGGAIAAADTLAITGLANDAVTSQSLTAASKTKRKGLFELYESDEQSTDVRRVHRFAAEITANATGDRGQEDFEKYDLRVRPTGDIAIEDVPIRTT